MTQERDNVLIPERVIKLIKKDVNMRKTRSRGNQGLIKIEPENKDEDDLVCGRTPKKRGRPKTQLEEKATDLLSSVSASPNINEPVHIPKDINEDTLLASKKAPKALIRNGRPRKVARNLKKEFSKSNFCMSKILQNNTPKDSLKGDKMLKYIDQYINASTNLKICKGISMAFIKFIYLLRRV